MLITRKEQPAAPRSRDENRFAAFLDAAIAERTRDTVLDAQPKTDHTLGPASGITPAEAPPPTPLSSPAGEHADTMPLQRQGWHAAERSRAVLAGGSSLLRPLDALCIGAWRQNAARGLATEWQKISLLPTGATPAPIPIPRSRQVSRAFPTTPRPLPAPHRPASIT